MVWPNLSFLGCLVRMDVTRDWDLKQKYPFTSFLTTTAMSCQIHGHAKLVECMAKISSISKKPGLQWMKMPAGVEGDIPLSRMERSCNFVVPWAESARPNLLGACVVKSFREELWFKTKHRREFVNITSQVERVVQHSGIQEGLVLVNAMHITASVYINDDESGLLEDYERFLEGLVPQRGEYRHNLTGEDNGDAHIKRQIMGREVVVAITGGALDFGPWEQIFYAEFDGKRKKRVLVKVIGE